MNQVFSIHLIVLLGFLTILKIRLASGYQESSGQYMVDISQSGPGNGQQGNGFALASGQPGDGPSVGRGQSGGEKGISVSSGVATSGQASHKGAAPRGVVVSTAIAKKAQTLK